MQIVEGNSLSAYARFGKMASSRTLSYLRERKERFRSSFLSERMHRLFDDFDNSSRRLNMDLLADEIRIAKRRNDHAYDDGHVTYLKDCIDIQHANPTMRNLIMADPYIRSLAKDGQIEGWSTVYRDPDKGREGWRHRDYRRLYKGLYRTEEDGVVRSRYYYEDQGANELTLTEKLDALRTIDHVKRLIRKGNGEDPTSLNGGVLS